MICERTKPAACCARCQGTGYVEIFSRFSQKAVREPCDHTFATDVTGLTDDEQRILDLESKLSQCAATCEEESRKAREMALDQCVEAAQRIIRDTQRQLERDRESRELDAAFAGHVVGAEEVLAAIQALKAKNHNP